MRILSLLPSATEIICSLGLADQLVGVTHECDFPSDVLRLPKATKTFIPADASSAEIDQLVREKLQTQRSLYALYTSVLERLAPDLIVTQSLCDVCAVAEDDISQAVLRLPKKPSVINLTPTSLPQVFEAIDLVAQATGCEQRAAEVKSRLHDRIHAVTDRSAMIRRQPRVAFVEWLIPPFSSGHWNPDLVDMAGGREGLGRSGMPSRTLDWSEVVAWQPEVLFVACCGYDVAKTLQDLELLRSEPHWSSIPAFRNHRVYVADGSQYFNRPGPRLVDSLEIMAHALHPDVHPIPDHLVGHQAILWK